MNLLDYGLVALLTLCALLGALKGVVKIASGLAGLCIAILFAGQLSPPVATALTANGLPQGVAPIAAYGLVFLAILLTAAVLAWLVTRGLEAADVGWLNRLLGGLAGVGLGLLIGSGAILGLTALAGAESPALAGSLLTRPVLTGSSWIVATTPEPFKQRLREQRVRLEERWRKQTTKS